MPACTKCSIDKPADAYYVDKRYDRPRPECKACAYARMIVWARANKYTGRPAHRPKDLRPKLCKGICHTVWPRKEYERHGRVLSRCKSCYRDYQRTIKRRAYRDPGTRERQRARNRARYHADIERGRAQLREQYAKWADRRKRAARRKRLADAKRHFAEQGHVLLRMRSGGGCRTCLEGLPAAA
jgi:hypothetical protein